MRPRIVGIGDSLSASPYVIQGGAPMHGSYLRALDAMLYPYGWEIRPAGRAGYKFGDWNDARLIAEATGFDIALVMLGTNEAIAGDSLASIRTQAQRVYTTLGALGCVVWPVTVAPCNLVSDTIRDGHNVDVLTGYYTTLASATRAIDADAALTDGQSPANLQNRFDAVDGIHWNMFGAIEVAKMAAYRLLLSTGWGAFNL